MPRLKPAVLLVAFCAACSTGQLTPDIKTFGKTVESIASADAASPAGQSLAGRVKAARRADFAAAGVVYGTSDRGACENVRPDLNVDAKPFDQVCTLVPMTLSGADLVTVASEYDPEAAQASAGQIVKARDRALLREHLAFALRSDLVAYGKALAALAESQDPAAIGTAAGGAFDAITGLQDAVSAAASSTGVAAPAGAARKPARTLITTLGREIAETLRYRTLKTTVEAADPYVSKAAVQLAILAYEGEGAALAAKTARVTDAIDNTAPGSEADLAAVEAAYAGAADADAKAAYRRYAEIGATHRAIVAALKGPPDLERLGEANKRIVALAKAFKDFAEAID